MFVTANVIGAERPSAIVVPQLAVQQSPKGNFVVVANAENHAELRPVIVGTYVNDKEIVIEQGLKSGDRVIVDGLVRVVPNAPVKPTPLTAPAAKPPLPPLYRQRQRNERTTRIRAHHVYPLLHCPANPPSVISLLIVLAGAVSLAVSPIEQYPDMAPPQIQVTARYPAPPPKSSPTPSRRRWRLRSTASTTCSLSSRRVRPRAT